MLFTTGGVSISWTWLLPIFSICVFLLCIRRKKQKLQLLAPVNKRYIISSNASLIVFSIVVNCWFCNQDVSVRYDERNTFTCPSCFQYNGFTSDGDYNRDIPQMYDASLNPPVNRRVNAIGESRHPLCPKCRHEQSLLIQKIAAFEPTSDQTFHKELAAYRKELEQLYHLCDRCESAVSAKLEEVTLSLSLFLSFSLSLSIYLYVIHVCIYVYCMLCSKWQW